MKRRNRATRVWVGYFPFGCYLSGILSGWMGSPGIIQVIELKRMQSVRLKDQTNLQSEIDSIKKQMALLEHHRKTQLKEIRRVMTYVAADELIFDFPEAPRP